MHDQPKQIHIYLAIRLEERRHNIVFPDKLAIFGNLLVNIQQTVKLGNNNNNGVIDVIIAFFVDDEELLCFFFLFFYYYYYYYLVVVQ